MRDSDYEVLEDERDEAQRERDEAFRAVEDLTKQARVWEQAVNLSVRQSQHLRGALTAIADQNSGVWGRVARDALDSVPKE